MSSRPEFAAVADVCVDLILRGDVRPKFGQAEQLVDGFLLEAGGSASIFAAQCAGLGATVAVSGVVGDDVFGKFYLDRLGGTGVDISLIRKVPGLVTGLGVALCADEDRAILTYPGTIAAAGADELASLAALHPGHWHIASYFLLERLRDSWESTIDRLRSAGASISLDANWDPAGRWNIAPGVLEKAHVLLANETEICHLAGMDDPQRAARSLASRGPLVVVKCGSRGAFVAASQTGELIHAEAAPAQSVSDSVGAGDRFDAGFLRAWKLGRPLNECLNLGNRCGVAGLRLGGGIAGRLINPEI